MQSGSSEPPSAEKAYARDDGPYPGGGTQREFWHNRLRHATGLFIVHQTTGILATASTSRPLPAAGVAFLFSLRAGKRRERTRASTARGKEGERDQEKCFMSSPGTTTLVNQFLGPDLTAGSSPSGKGSLRNRRADLPQRGPSLIGMDESLRRVCRSAGGMDDGAAMVLVLKRGEDK